MIFTSHISFDNALRYTITCPDITKKYQFQGSLTKGLFFCIFKNNHIVYIFGAKVII